MAGPRGAWNSRFGFIMAAVGSAVGLGNLVRFPRELADNGGAAYLFIYLILLVLVGLPALLGEMSLGKMAELSPVRAFQKLGGKHGKKWAVLGVFGMLAAMFVLFFYIDMTGWTLRFFFASFWDAWWDDPEGYYDRVAYGPGAILWHGIVAAIVVAIVARGISGGIERVVTIVIPALFVIVIGIVIYALFQPGMTDGYRAIFDPDFGELSPNNIASAVGQVFFSLSLGQGAMLTYASYMEKKQSVTQDGTITAFADTGVAMLAAMMIFPVLAFTGLLTSPIFLEQESSFGTAFIAMPSAFVQMGDVVGRVVGTVFFLGLFFAALSSAISLLEVPTSVLVDSLGVVRWKAALLLGFIVYSFGVVSAVNADWFTLYDEIAVNFFIVAGVAFTTFFAGWIVPGVGKELDSGLRSRIGIYLVWVMRTVTPVLILVVFLFGGLFGNDVNGDILFWASGDCGSLAEADCEANAAGWRELGHDFQKAFGFE